MQGDAPKLAGCRQRGSARKTYSIRLVRQAGSTADIQGYVLRSPNTNIHPQITEYFKLELGLEAWSLEPGSLGVAHAK